MSTASMEKLESTDLSPWCLQDMTSWLNGGLSGRVLAMKLDDKLDQFSRTRRAPSRQSAKYSDLELLLGSLVDSKAEQLFEDYFQGGSVALLRKAVNVLGEPAILQSPSPLQVPRLNKAYRRHVLSSRWAMNALKTDSSSHGPPDALVVDLESLFIYMECIRAFLFNNGVNCAVREVSLPRGIEYEWVQQHLRGSSTSLPSPPVVESLNTFLDEYMVRLMRLKSQLAEKILQSEEAQLYAVLGLSPSASNGEVKKAYRARAVQLHPDKPFGDTLLFQELNEAYERILQKRSTESSIEEPEVCVLPIPTEKVRKPSVSETCVKCLENCLKMCLQLQRDSTLPDTEVLEFAYTVVKSLRSSVEFLDRQKTYSSASALTALLAPIETVLADKESFVREPFIDQLVKTVEQALNFLSTRNPAPARSKDEQRCEPTDDHEPMMNAAVPSVKSSFEQNSLLLQRLNTDVIELQTQIMVALRKQKKFIHGIDSSTLNWCCIVVLEHMEDAIRISSAADNPLANFRSECEIFSIVVKSECLAVIPSSVARAAKLLFMLEPTRLLSEIGYALDRHGLGPIPNDDVAAFMTLAIRANDCEPGERRTLSINSG